MLNGECNTPVLTLYVTLIFNSITLEVQGRPTLLPVFQQSQVSPKSVTFDPELNHIMSRPWQSLMSHFLDPKKEAITLRKIFVRSFQRMHYLPKGFENFVIDKIIARFSFQ